MSNNNFKLVMDKRTGKVKRVPNNGTNPAPPSQHKHSFQFQPIRPPPPPPQNQQKPVFQFQPIPPPPPQNPQKPVFQFHQPEAQPRMRKPITKDSTTQTLPLQSTDKPLYPLVPVKPAPPPNPISAPQTALKQNNPYHYQQYYDDINSYDILQYQDRNNERNHELRKANLQYQDNQNQRNHERQLHRIDHIAQITNAQLALNDQAHQQQIERYNVLTNMTTTRNPLSEEAKAREIVTAAALVNYDINSNPLEPFISQQFVEPNYHKPFYSHSYLFAGVQNYKHEKDFTITFVNNRHKPIIIQAQRGEYFTHVQSNNLNHIILVRCYHPSLDFDDSNKFKLCPCIDCNIS